MKHYKGMTIEHEFNPEASHQPALIYAVEHSTGDILELGCGRSSTNFLHHIVANTNRKIVSVEDNYQWMQNFLHLTDTNHSFQHTDASKWNETTDFYCKKEWGVVLVDQGSTKEIGDPARTYSAQKLVNCSEYVIVHDGDCLPQIQSNEYNWKMFVPKYGGPHTYILSKKHDLTDIEIIED